MFTIYVSQVPDPGISCCSVNCARVVGEITSLAASENGILLGTRYSFLPLVRTDSPMTSDESRFHLLRIEDKSTYEDSITYIYVGNERDAVYRPITVYKEKNANAYLVAGRYAGVTDTHLKYKPITKEERRLVTEKLGPGKVVRFLSNS
jgi:hypothetical protein